MSAEDVPAATERATSGSFHFDSMGGTFALDGPAVQWTNCPAAPTSPQRGWNSAGGLLLCLSEVAGRPFPACPTAFEEISRGRRALRPPAGGAQVGGGLGGGGAVPGRRGRRGPPPLLRPGHVPVSLGRPAHGPPGGVLGRRRDRPAEAHAGLQRAA